MNVSRELTIVLVMGQISHQSHNNLNIQENNSRSMKLAVNAVKAIVIAATKDIDAVSLESLQYEDIKRYVFD